MPSKRTLRTRKLAQPITEAAVEAFNAGDWMTLHRELKLPPWCCGDTLITHPHGHTDEFGRTYAPWYRREALRNALLAACHAD